jgi:hypothetical protein
MTRSACLAVVVILVFVSGAGAQDAYCTLGQYVWGHATREFNNIAMPVLLDSLITDVDPLAVGMPGRGVTFLDGSEPTITTGLTASWKPAPLPDDLGDAVVDSTCVLPPGFPAKKNGKFRGSLLGETIALSLNTRLDPDLLTLEVCPVMLTVRAAPGPDGLHGTTDDSLCARCDTMTVRIPEEVLTALGDSTGAAVTVGDILGLANLTLAGQDTLFDVTARRVYDAVKVINRGFKDCRYLVSCNSGAPDTVFAVDYRDAIFPDDPRIGGSEAADSDREWGELSLVTASPVSDVAVVHYGLPEPCRLTISIYSVAGRLLDVLIDGEVNQPSGFIQVPIEAGRMPSGVYFVRMVARGSASGRGYSASDKMLVLR